MIRRIRCTFQESRNAIGWGRLTSLLVITFFAALGVIILIAGTIAQLFGVEVASVFTLGKALVAVPMWAGVVTMFSFICRM